MFLALDHLIQHIRDHDFVDIYGLVAELRSERMCMVQNLVGSQESKLKSPSDNYHRHKKRKKDKLMLKCKYI